LIEFKSKDSKQRHSAYAAADTLRPLMKVLMAKTFLGASSAM
jgi:hypothetical protein